MVMTGSDELISLEEAAELLCVSKSTLYRMLERKEVKGYKVGRQWRFNREELQAYLDRGPQAVILASVGTDEIDALLETLAEPSQRLGVAMPDIEPAALPEDKVTIYVDHLILLAIASRASDIHLAPERHHVATKLRIDGVLNDLCQIPITSYPAVIGQIKQYAGLNLDERALPQDGRIRSSVAGREFDIRVSVLPTVFGECVVMRILDQNAVLIGLERLRFMDDDLARLRRWIASPNGVILCTGPTGSGKTTTLYSCLQAVASPTKNTVSIEDPVEYILPHTRQTNVNRRAGLSFTTAMRALLRQDPDVILIGEIQDREAAVITVQAALTGHLVLSTLHTNTAASTARRLVEMGCEPFLVAGSLHGVVAQRLARCVCQQCKTPVSLPSAVEAHIREKSAQGGYVIPQDAQFYQGVGCENCGGRGYRGRIGLYELLEFTPTIREAFLNGASDDELSRLTVSDGMYTMLADGIRKAVDGITTVDEVLRVAMA